MKTGLLLSLALMLAVMASAFAADEITDDMLNTLPVIRTGVDTETLILTDDINIAEAQVKAYPGNPEAWFLLSIAYSRSPYLEKGFLAMKKAKKLIKHSDGGYANFNKKIREYEAMSAYRQGDTLVLYRLAFAYFTKGYLLENGYIKNTDETHGPYYQQAEATMRGVIAIDPDDVWAKNYLGFLLVDMYGEKRLDEAMALWESVVAEDPANPGANIMLGESWIKKGNLKKAARYAVRGLEGRLAWELSN